MCFWVEARGSVISYIVLSVHRGLGSVLQGDPNSGLTLNDLTSTLMLFADDMVVLANNVLELQNNKDLLYTYCSNWGLQVNTDKTKIVVFRKQGGLKYDESWTYNRSPLEVVNDFNYLGTVFNYTCTFALNKKKSLLVKALKHLIVSCTMLKHTH